TDQDRDLRTSAILRLFWSHVPIDATSDAIQQVLGNSGWLDESMIEGPIGFMAGDDESVRFTADSTLFRINLLPTSRIRASGYAGVDSIYFKLSGYSRTLNDAKQFFGLKTEPEERESAGLQILGTAISLSLTVYGAMSQGDSKSPECCNQAKE